MIGNFLLSYVAEKGAPEFYHSMDYIFGWGVAKNSIN